MPDVSQIIRLRRQQKARELRSPWGKLGLLSALSASLLLACLALAGAWYAFDLMRGLPAVDGIASLLEPPNGSLLQPTRIYDRTRSHVILTLAYPAAAPKRYLLATQNGGENEADFSPTLVEATVSELDPSFWTSWGFSLSGIGEHTHSTIAQKLISSLVLADQPLSVKQSIRERILALEVTSQYGRAQVMEWYLNSARYGDMLYGADGAARVFFNKSAANVSLAEAAMLVALSESAGNSPTWDPSALKKQQELIIQRMLVGGVISAEEARNALEQEIQLQEPTLPASLAPGFTELVMAQLSTSIPFERIYRGGLEIVTSLDYDLQMQAECTTRVQLSRIQSTDEPSVTSDGNPCEMSHLLPTLPPTAGKSPQVMQAEVLVIEPRTGQILSFVGGEGAGRLPETPETHPAGNILSPFLYLTAFTEGMSPASLLWDIPITTTMGEAGDNETGLSQQSYPSYIGPVSLRKAMANDYTGAAGEVLQRVEAEKVWSTEKMFGISLPGIASASVIDLQDFQSQSASLFDIVKAYSVLANDGNSAGQTVGGEATRQLSSSSILMVEGVDGKVWLDWTAAKIVPIVSPQLTYLTTNVLSDEKVRLSTPVDSTELEVGRPAAVKASLTQAGNDAWTVGYIPQLVVGAWIGTPVGMPGGISADMPAGLWHAILEYASSSMAVEDFSQPDGISLMQVCDPSGLLVTPLCPSVVQEVFLAGNEQTQADNLYQKFAIDRETGLLGTLFTPADKLEEKVFLTIPPEAKAWAVATGFPQPPDTYDAVSYAPPVLDGVGLAEPSMSEHVSGQVMIKGSAGGENFSYYRIQVGQGLYPQEWYQVGQDVNLPVSNGLLGTWDTRGLDGIYILELLVVKQDKQFAQALVQVSVDNTPPQVQILSPGEGEQLSLSENPMVVNASVSDNEGVQRVEYYVDGKLEFILYEKPWIYIWTTQPGDHALRVKAFDQAGNIGEASVTFLINK